jgi:prepilin-type processing-associated H-X9-DG protein
VKAVIAILAALLFPTFSQAREKARLAACFAQLKQIGAGLSMYVQDYDERLPNTCRWGRAWTWSGVWDQQLAANKLGTGANDFTGSCAQAGITRTTPKDTFLGPEQTPPRYFQELLHPYVKDGRIWFCPSVRRERLLSDDPTQPTYGFNGTTYLWNWVIEPGQAAPNPFSRRPLIALSGLALSAIPRSAEAPVVWEMPYWNPIKPPCTQLRIQPAHARGVNVLYADTHVKFSHFSNHPVPGDCTEDWWSDHHWEGFYE